MPGQTATISSPDGLAGRTIKRRGAEAIIWGIPVVNYDMMYQAMVNAARGGFNQILYWTHPFDWKNQTLTPNTDALYLMPFFQYEGRGANRDRDTSGAGWHNRRNDHGLLADPA